MRSESIISSMLIAMVLFTSCQSGVKEENQTLKDQLETLTKENDRLRNANGTTSKNNTITEYQRTLEEIDYNLRTIELNLIQVSSPDKRNVPVKVRIENRLLVIQKLIQNSNLKIRDLDQNLNDLRISARDKSKEVLAMEKVMKNAAKVLIAQEEEFNQKKAELEIDEADVAKTYEEQLAITYELFKIVNRAYYLKATTDELREFGILNEESLFVGISTLKVQLAATENSPFTQIEKDQSNSFLFNNDRVQLISIHPEDSYTLKRAPSKTVLTIKNKKSFWKNGNYLIVEVR